MFPECDPEDRRPRPVAFPVTSPITLLSAKYQRLSRFLSAASGNPSVCWCVERLFRLDKPYSVTASVSHNLNDELTIILSSALISMQMLDLDHPVVPLLLEIQCAAERCADRAQGLLKYSWRKGGLPVTATFESLIE